MLAVIFMNSILLALYDYSDRESTTRYNQIIDQVNVIFTAFFIFEASLKITGKGLVFHENAYLRSGWNLIDIVVVISGILELAMGSVKLKSLRVVRVFRPLKTINVIPSMKKLIGALISSLPDFANVGAFLAYMFLVFATMGIHQYSGIFYNLCRFNPEPENSTMWVFDPTVQRVCTESELGNYVCPSGEYCGNH